MVAFNVERNFDTFCYGRARFLKLPETLRGPLDARTPSAKFFELAGDSEKISAFTRGSEFFGEFIFSKFPAFLC